MTNSKEDIRPAQEGIFNSALQNLSRAWREIARFSGRNGGKKQAGPDDLRRQIEACLAGQGGEVSARARAASLARAYLDFSKEERLAFLTVLAGDFGVDEAKVDAAVEALKQAAEKPPPRRLRR